MTAVSLEHLSIHEIERRAIEGQKRAVLARARSARRHRRGSIAATLILLALLLAAVLAAGYVGWLVGGGS